MTPPWNDPLSGDTFFRLKYGGSLSDDKLHEYLCKNGYPDVDIDRDCPSDIIEGLELEDAGEEYVVYDNEDWDRVVRGLWQFEEGGEP